MQVVKSNKKNVLHACYYIYYYDVCVDVDSMQEFFKLFCKKDFFIFSLLYCTMFARN